MGRRFLQRLQSSALNRRVAEHVDFVDDVDLIICRYWGEVDFFLQVPDVINAVFEAASISISPWRGFRETTGT